MIIFRHPLLHKLEFATHTFWLLTGPANGCHLNANGLASISLPYINLWLRRGGVSKAPVGNQVLCSNRGDPMSFIVSPALEFSNNDEITRRSGKAFTPGFGDEHIVDQANSESLIQPEYGRFHGDNHACFERVIASGIHD